MAVRMRLVRNSAVGGTKWLSGCFWYETHPLVVPNSCQDAIGTKNTRWWYEMAVRMRLVRKTPVGGTKCRGDNRSLLFVILRPETFEAGEELGFFLVVGGGVEDSAGEV